MYSRHYKDEKVNIMEKSYTNFGEFIVVKREERQMSLRKLAEYIGVSAPYWSDVEKNRKNPPKIAGLRKIADILKLSEDETTTMLDLAGKDRNTVAPDIPEYIMQNDYVAAALRTVRDLGAEEEDWMKFVDELKKRKG
jgi:transcriptional regulator with XRE-family HTH domain